MKKSLLLLAALACSGVVAQEKQVWACQQIEGTMLFWENSSWRQIAISAGPILLTIDGENSSYKIMDGETGLSCSPADAFTSCLTEFPVEHILMDTATGRMGISGLFGALRTKTESRNFVSTQVYNCTKF